jgi:DNA modification methylase
MALAQRRIEIDWDFRGENTKALTHCFHDYPAKMIPQIAEKLLDLFGSTAKKLLDPYCGTGTSLVEAQIRGIDAVGYDINPLACLIAKVKTTPISKQILDLYLKDFLDFAFMARFNPNKGIVELPEFSNLSFWFHKETITELAHLKNYIEQIENEDVKDFFKVAFSETVRECSLTRNGEFKLYRMPEHKLAGFEPDVYGTMGNKLARNREGMLTYFDALKHTKRKAKVSVHNCSTIEHIKPENGNLCDIIITSPPYGDSHTTVAYGQYSRLSSEWLDFEDAHSIDKKLMGGKTSPSVTKFGCKALDAAIKEITTVDNKRAREVASFYVDLEKSIDNVASLVKKGGYACYVVGNRKVKGVTLPTDASIVSFFEKDGFTHVDTFIRSIPNKRMPAKNSPTNEAGKSDNTMLHEYIVVMRKQ